MQLADVTGAMIPGAQAAIKKGLSLQEAKSTFELVLMGEGMKQAEAEAPVLKSDPLGRAKRGVNKRAAALLKCSESYLRNTVLGKRGGTHFKRGSHSLGKNAASSRPAAGIETSGAERSERNK